MPPTRQIELPEDLCRRAEQVYAGQFRSCQDLLTFLLEQITREDLNRMNKEEQEIVEQRLKNLGYV